MNDNSKKFLSLSIWLTALLLFIRCLLSWVDLKNMLEGGHLFNLCYSIFGFIGEAIGAAAIVLAVFNKWAWKWTWIRWMHNVPVLKENYVGTITSDYHDKTVRSCRVTITQTFLNVAVQIKTDESSSRSITASFIDLHGVRNLIYTYQSEPRGEIQGHSPIHYGTAKLNATNPMILEGDFYTGRNTRGSVKFEAVVEK
ncbi:MAG: hypothetical protein AB9880_09770 [Christensenellales bacterium]